MCYAMSSRPKEWATQQSRWKTRHRVSRKQVVRCEQETKVRSHVSFGKCCQGVFVLLACCMCCSFGLLCLGVCLSLSLSFSFPFFSICAPSSESAQGWARHHSESNPTRRIPAEGSPASSRIRTAPQRERSDTPDPRRGFIGELKDSHGTTPIPAEGSPASDPTRPIPAEGSPASSRIRTAPQRERSDTPDPRRGFAGERSDTPDPCRGFIGELKDAHGTTARALRHARSL